jgi:ABC-2 type transport system ATP-binding protein
MVLGVINPSGGTYHWFDGERDHHVRKRIGSILESPSFYHYLSAKENLRVTARIKDVSEQRIPEVLERVGLLARQNDPFKAYSLGMKQRLAIASALLSNPEVMILDEPTNGLDPSGIAEIRDLMIELGNEGRTIITASHMLAEVQRICTDFAVLRHGKKIFQGKVHELEAENPRVRLTIESEGAADSVLDACPIALSHRKEGSYHVVTLKDGRGAVELNRFLVEKGVAVSSFYPETDSLERRFLEILKENSE